MNEYLEKLKQWYEGREIRERLFFMLLCWAVLYFIFYFIVFRSLDFQNADLVAAIKKTSDEIEHQNQQIAALNTLANSSQYKEWLSQRKSMENLQGQYKFLLRTSSTR